MLSRQHIISGLIDMRYAEGSTQTSYNLLNLPSLVDLIGGRKITNTYASDGRKLATVAKDGLQFTEGTKTYNGNLVFDLNGDLEYVLFPEGRILHDAGSFTYEYHLKDHLGSTRVAFTPSSDRLEVLVQINAFYPFGAPIAALSWSSQTQNKNRYKHTGMETIEDFGLGYVDNFARWRGNAYAGSMFLSIDPLAEKHPHLSPYIYCMNNPMTIIDPTGRDTIYVFDQGTRPIDNGTSGQTYGADIYVEQNGVISPSYRGSSYPNSTSNTDNTTPYNTVNEGEYPYNNQSGHSGGTQQGLNVVNSEGVRETPGTTPSGGTVTMTLLNVHSGTSDNGNYNSRGSAGCITIHPSDVADFMSNFNWSGASGNTGTSTGTIIIMKGENATTTRTRVERRREYQQNPTPIVARPWPPAVRL